MSVNVDILDHDLSAVCGVLHYLGFKDDKKELCKNTNIIKFGDCMYYSLSKGNPDKTLLDFLLSELFINDFVSAVAKQLELSLNQLSLEIGFSKNYLSRAINNNNLSLDTERKIFEKLLNLLKLDASGGCLNPVEHVGTPLDNVPLIECGELNNLRPANAELETINDEYVDIITHQEKHRGELIEKFDGVVSFMTGAKNEVKATLRKVISERDGLKEQLRKTQIIAFILLVACACLGLALGVAK